MSNLRAKDALERAHRLFLEKPAAAKRPNAMATAVWRDGLLCEIAGPTGERATTDMPEPMGGSGAGANPGWLLRAGIASCAATAIAMRAAMLGIELRTLEVNVQSESDARGLLGIPDAPTTLGNMRMAIRIAAEGADEATLRELAAWGEANSPVSCTLRDSPVVAVDVTIA
ncbi:MAG: OsmC family protein [Hyphomicrobium sp.]|nr:OsmC family protein [Hyphomicrobium sp.]